MKQKKHLGNVRSIELALTKRGLDKNREISGEIKEIRKYEQWIKNIDKEFKEIDNHFKQIMGTCAKKYHELLEELKGKRLGSQDLYRRVMKIHSIFESLHKKGLSSDELLRKELSDMFTEINSIKKEIGNDQNLRFLFVRYSEKIDWEVGERLKGYVIDKIVEIDNNIKNLIGRIKKIYGHIKTYGNIHKEIAKEEKELHEEIVELEKLHEKIKHLIAILANFEKQVVQMHRYF